METTQEFTVTLTQNEVNLILAALGELPAKVSIEMIIKIKSTCEEQIINAKKK